MNRRVAATLALAGALSMTAIGFARADDPDLTVFDWSGYEDPSFHPDYVKKYGQSPTFAFFADEDEAFAKLQAGFRADVAHPCSQSVVKWREAGLLQPLDTSKITGWKDILPGIKAMKNLMTGPDG
jgi:spermidine/putrescine-binding protein